MRTAIAAAVLVAATLVAAACVETPDPETPDSTANQAAPPAAAAPPAGASTAPATAAPPSANDAGRERAKQRYMSGRDAYDRGEFSTAAIAFEDAYRDFPSPAFLFNAAQAYRNLGDRPRAVALYRQFLAEEPNLNASIRDSVMAHITELSTPPP